MAAWAAAFPAFAQSPDELTQLKEEAARLRQYLDRLDQRIRLLEGTHGDAPAPIGAVPSYVAVLRSWSEIAPGMPKSRVDQLLGKPERVMRINGDLVWYYLYPDIGRGSVFFRGEETVSAVQPPRSAWSW